MRHDRIIDELSTRLGSQVALARRFGLSNTTICHWKGDGIPARHWPKLLDIAKRAGYPLTLTQIDSGSPLTAKPARAA